MGKEKEGNQGWVCFLASYLWRHMAWHPSRKSPGMQQQYHKRGARNVCSNFHQSSFWGCKLPGLLLGRAEVGGVIRENSVTRGPPGPEEWVPCQLCLQSARILQFCAWLLLDSLCSRQNLGSLLNLWHQLLHCCCFIAEREVTSFSRMVGALTRKSQLLLSFNYLFIWLHWV